MSAEDRAGDDVDRVVKLVDVAPSRKPKTIEATRSSIGAVLLLGSTAGQEKLHLGASFLRPASASKFSCALPRQTNISAEKKQLRFMVSLEMKKTRSHLFI
jgi:hypothetical protein